MPALKTLNKAPNHLLENYDDIGAGTASISPPAYGISFVDQQRNIQTQEKTPIQRKENNTGLPDKLKTGIEHLSGYTMDDVKVHFNSSKPAQLQAHAYAQGTDIHLAPGQERHLPHEAWHVVQQKQGRVKPTMQLKGKVNVNDDAGLEREADVMGKKAGNWNSVMDDSKTTDSFLSQLLPQNRPIQRQLVDGYGKNLTNEEINNLKKIHPHLVETINSHQDSKTEYIARTSRRGIIFSEYRPPSNKKWKWSIPKDFETSFGTESVYNEAKNSGLKMNLKRTPMKNDFTKKILDNQKFMGITSKGSSDLLGGKGLKSSGLARTHHVADSSVRAIIEYLNSHRSLWANDANSIRKIREWMKTMTHGIGTAQQLLNLLIKSNSTNDLESIINGLSNNEWNVGIGDADINSKVGPMRDASYTKSGYPTLQTFLTGFGLSYLKGIVPENILKAADGQLINKETHKPLYSMKNVKVNYSALPRPGRYVPNDLTDQEILAIVNRANMQNRIWAQQIILVAAGNHRDIVSYVRLIDIGFRIDKMGSIWQGRGG